MNTPLAELTLLTDSQQAKLEMLEFIPTSDDGVVDSGVEEIVK